MNAAHPSFQIHPRRSDHEHAVRLLEGYFEELRALLGDFDPTRSVSADPDEMTPPHGFFVVAYEADQPIGCGGFKALAPGVAEIKRMFVAKEARARGHGRRILIALEDAARHFGHRRLLLDTAAPLDEAAALYLSAGYRQIDPYNQNPYATRWFAKVW